MIFDCGLCVPVICISAKITWFSRISSLEVCQLKGEVSKFVEIIRSQLDQLNDVAIVCFGEEDLWISSANALFIFLKKCYLGDFIYTYFPPTY